MSPNTFFNEYQNFKVDLSLKVPLYNGGANYANVRQKRHSAIEKTNLLNHEIKTLIKEIEIMYGMDKPAHERFFKMLKSYIFFDFGESFFRDQKVTSLVLDKMPVSISLGLWTTLLVYLISIPLGIRKAINDGSKFENTLHFGKLDFLKI